MTRLAHDADLLGPPGTLNAADFVDRLTEKLRDPVFLAVVDKILAAPRPYNVGARNTKDAQVAAEVACLTAELVGVSRYMDGVQRLWFAATFIKRWEQIDSPISIRHWEDMLVPGRASKFNQPTVIPVVAADWLKERAALVLSEDADTLALPGNAAQKKHLEEIAAGRFPYGYTESP